MWSRIEDSLPDFIPGYLLAVTFTTYFYVSPMLQSYELIRMVFSWERLGQILFTWLLKFFACLPWGLMFLGIGSSIEDRTRFGWVAASLVTSVAVYVTMLGTGLSVMLVESRAIGRMLNQVLNAVSIGYATPLVFGSWMFLTEYLSQLREKSASP
jgi:hypothetical protein